MKTCIQILILFHITLSSFSQVIPHPNFGTKSHPTLQIDKIVIAENATVFYLTVENQVTNGWFCADKKIYIKNSLGSEKYALLNSKNIPVCPQTRQFTMIGEKLSFELYFPKIDSQIKYIDLVEDCKESCFSFRGIILSQTMNRDIDMAFKLYAQNKSDLATIGFCKLATDYPDYPYGINILHLIRIYSEMRKTEEAKKWYNKILQSNYRDKTEILNTIKTNKYID